MKNKIITMCVYNRPHYLKQVFEHLSRCIGINDYYLFISFDNDDSQGCKESYELCKQFDSCEKDIHINTPILGCNQNTKFALSVGLTECEDFNIHLEDDVLISRDSLWFFEKASGQFRNYIHNDKYPTHVGLWTSSINASIEYFKLFNNIYINHLFNPWGWGTWKRELDTLMNNWMIDGRKYKIDGKDISVSWDMVVNQIIWDKQYGIYPRIIRSKHIGSFGTHHNWEMKLVPWLEDEDLPYQDLLDKPLQL